MPGLTRESLVVDDQAETPNPIGQTGRGIEVRAQAEIVILNPPLVTAFSSETPRIHPHRIIAWNIDEFSLARPARLPHMQGYNSATCPGKEHAPGSPGSGRLLHRSLVRAVLSTANYQDYDMH
jgi:hypothetical protein